MFALGLGSSVSSVTPLVMPKDIEAVENSKISTFEMIPGNFSTDYDGALRDAFLRMLRRTGKKAVSYHIPFSRQDDFSDPNEKFRKAAVSRFRALLHEAFLQNYCPPPQHGTGCIRRPHSPVCCLP